MAQAVAVDEATAFIAERLEITQALPHAMTLWALRHLERKQPGLGQHLRRRYGVPDRCGSSPQEYQDSVPLALIPVVRILVLQIEPPGSVGHRLWSRVLSAQIVETESIKFLEEAVARFGHDAVYAAGCKLGLTSTD